MPPHRSGPVRRDHSGPILGSNGSMATSAKRDMQQSSADHGSQDQQPFGKIRGRRWVTVIPDQSKTCSENQ